MVKSAKCQKCTKVLGKKFPGIQCSKCSKWLHCNGTCTSLTSEQLSALSTTDSIDWKCRTCSAGGKPKRLSVILPDTELEDEESEAEATTEQKSEQEKQILLDIRKEVREIRQSVKDIIKEELQDTLRFYSEKIDDYEERMKDQETKLLLMEKKVKHLTDSNKNLELKHEVLNQKLSKLEQIQICNVVEICGIDEEKDENVKQIVSTVCQVLQQNKEDIIKAHRKKTQTRTGTAQAARIANEAPISVTLRDGCQDLWLHAAKNTNIMSSILKKASRTQTAAEPNNSNKTVQPAGMAVGAASVDSSDRDRGAGKRIYIRAALTPSVAYLLWKAKSELKPLCKHVWCKDGRIMVRKEDNAKKIFYVHTAKDIEEIKSSLLSVPEG